MDLFDAIEQRFSYREGFQDKPIGRDALRRIVEAGLRAPSGCNAQTTEFVIVDDPDTARRIGAMHDRNQAVREAKAFVLCITDREPRPVYADLHFQAEDCAAAVENMLLAITAMGYASVWVDGWLRVEGRAQAIGRLVGLPPEKTVRVLLPVGIPKNPNAPRPKKKPFGERAWFNHYGEAS